MNNIDIKNIIIINKLQSCGNLIKQNKLNPHINIINHKNFRNNLLDELNNLVKGLHLKKILVLCDKSDVINFYKIYKKNYQNLMNNVYIYHNLIGIKPYNGLLKEELFEFSDLYMDTYSQKHLQLSTYTTLLNRKIKFGIDNGILFTNSITNMSYIRNIDCVINLKYKKEDYESLFTYHKLLTCISSIKHKDIHDMKIMIVEGCPNDINDVDDVDDVNKQMKNLLKLYIDFIKKDDEDDKKLIYGDIIKLIDNNKINIFNVNNRRICMTNTRIKKLQELLNITSSDLEQIDKHNIIYMIDISNNPTIKKIMNLN